MSNEESNRLSRRDLLKAAPIAAVGVAAATSSPLWLPPSAVSAKELKDPTESLNHQVPYTLKKEYAPKDVFGNGSTMQSYDWIQRGKSVYAIRWQTALIKDSSYKYVLWTHLLRSPLRNSTEDVPDHSDYDIVVHGPKDARYELSTMDRYGDHGRNLHESNRPSLPDHYVPGGPGGLSGLGSPSTTHNLQMRGYSDSIQQWLVVDFYDPHTYTWRRRVLDNAQDIVTFQNALREVETATLRLRQSAGMSSVAVSLAHALAAHSVFSASPTYDVAAIALGTVTGYHYWRQLQAALATVAPLFNTDNTYNSNATDNIPPWPRSP